NTRQLRAQLFVAVPRKIGAQVLITGMAIVKIVAQQPLDGLGDLGGIAAIAHWTRGALVPAHCPADTEIICVHQSAITLQLLSLDAAVGDPVLAATIGAAGHVQLQLLIEGWKTLFQLLHQPACEPFSLSDCQLAELRASAGDRAAPERRRLDVQSNSVELTCQCRCLALQ